MLSKSYRRATKAGGAAMPVEKYARVFGNGTALRKNVLRACADSRYGAAIEHGTFADHRVIESLTKMGVLASGIVLDVEDKLGRKLTRSRAQALAKAYLHVRRQSEANMRIAAILQAANVICLADRKAA